MPESLPGADEAVSAAVKPTVSPELLARIEAALGPERTAAARNATTLLSLSEAENDKEIRKVEIAPDDPMSGDKNAPVTIVVWSDFQCPFCGRHAANVHKLEQEFPGLVRVVFKQYPLPFHNRAMPAAMASLAAHEQGKFWPMHDTLFFESGQLSEESLSQWAAEAGIDLPKLLEAVESGRFEERVRKDMQQGESLGVRGTPASFFNGVHVSGAVPLDKLNSHALLALQRAYFLLLQGTPPENVYETIISAAPSPQK